MRVVLDTNVLVSAMLSAAGPCARVVELALEGLLLPCIDGRVLAEYREVLCRTKLGIAPADADSILRVFELSAESVSAPPLATKLPDADDLPFLEGAASAGAVLVTGNLRHFPKNQRKGVPVVRPAELLDLLREVS